MTFLIKAGREVHNIQRIKILCNFFFKSTFSSIAADLDICFNFYFSVCYASMSVFKFLLMLMFIEDMNVFIYALIMTMVE